MIWFLAGCLYMTVGQGVIIGGLNFPVIRILLLVGIARVIVRGEGISGGLNRIDKLMIAFSIWLIFASFFHIWGPGSGPVYTAGAVLNTAGFYFMVRAFCRDQSELVDLIGVLCLLLLPLAVAMFVEQVTHWNAFSIFGGVPDVPVLRNDRYRAQGPFNHAILAGTVAALCFPLAISIWRRNRMASIIGIVSSLLMVYSCASSGPIMSVVFAVFALFMWKYRHLVPGLWWMAGVAYLVLEVVMERPPYFLISKINLTGASTGWHRSYLIQQTLAHFNEWWLFGTDRTVHWMPSQGRISDMHTDITNQYIAYGVAGGILAVGLVIWMMLLAFGVVGKLVNSETMEPNEKFMFWCFGASLFSVAASSISVGFFGQAIFFFWLPIACLASFARAPELEAVVDSPEPAVAGGRA